MEKGIMKKELTVQTVIDANNILKNAKLGILKNAKLGKMKDGENFQVVKALRAIKSAAMPAQELIDVANEKLKPENFEELQGKAARFESLTDAEKIEVNNRLVDYQNRVARCTTDELKKTVKIEISPLSEDSFCRLVESNEFTAGGIMTLQDVLCK